MVESTLLYEAVPVLLDGGEVLLHLASAGLREMEKELLPFLTHLSQTHLPFLHTLQSPLNDRRTHL